MKKRPADATAEDRFGCAVSISGDTLVAGVYGKDDDGNNSGAAYVFQRDFGGADHWGQIEKLKASDGAGGANFGYAVFIHGSTIIVSAYSAGAAYVFDRDAGGLDNWGETKILCDYFGSAVGISADTIVIGRPGSSDNGFMAGAAFVHERDDGGSDNRSQVKELLPIAAGELPGDHFGKSVDIDGDIAVVGAYSARDDYGSNFGTAYVFERDHLGPDNWGQFKMIMAFSAGASGDNFGWSVGRCERQLGGSGRTLRR